MKFVVRWLFRLTLLALVLAVGLVLLKDTLLREAGEIGFRHATGLEARIGQVRAGVLTPTLYLRDVRVFNPALYGGNPAFTFAEIHLEYDPHALLHRRQIRLRLLRFDLAETTVVEVPNRPNSLVALHSQLQQRLRELDKPFFDFGGIDTLTFSLGSLRVVRLEPAAPPPRVYPLGVREEILTQLHTPADFITAAARISFRLGLRAWTNTPTAR